MSIFFTPNAKATCFGKPRAKCQSRLMIVLKGLFIKRNNNVLTAVRHRQKATRVIASNKQSVRLLVRANYISFVSARRAHINYRYGKPSLPAIAANAKRL